MVGAWMLFSVVVAAWVAFGYFAIAAPGTLETAWEWTRAQHIIVQGVVWLLTLPWMIALAIWQSTWAVWLRATLVLGMAWAVVNMFLPQQ